VNYSAEEHKRLARQLGWINEAGVITEEGRAAMKLPADEMQGLLDAAAHFLLRGITSEDGSEKGIPPEVQHTEEELAESRRQFIKRLEEKKHEN